MSKKTVLLVEDNENDAFFITTALQQAGVNDSFHVVEDGKEALAYLQGDGKYADREAYPVPYLILLDLKLPFVPGLQVLKWVRERPEFDTTVVLVLTSSNNRADLEAAYRLRANAYLVKPSGLEEVRRLARSIHDFWLLQNQPAPPFSL
jgi:CheY-like chemotaxis protein